MQVNDQARRLGDLCTALVRRLRLLERSELSCCGIPMSQAMVLQTLEASRDGRRMSEIAEALGVAQSTATRLVEPLVQEDRVERRPAPDDGRAVVIALTSKGRNSARELAKLPDKRRAAVEMKILEGLTYREIADALDAPLGTVSFWVRESLMAVTRRLKDLE